MVIEYQEGTCEVSVGPSRLFPGEVAILVQGPEPNAVASAMRSEAQRWGCGEPTHGRPILVDGAWVAYGTARVNQ